MTHFQRCEKLLAASGYTEPRLLSRKLFCFRRVYYLSVMRNGIRIRVATTYKKRQLLKAVAEYLTEEY